MSSLSERDRKYDRQLRLWAATGQGALERASVLLIGSSALATEIAKNLVLPGVGKITIADDSIVSDSDLLGSFFVEEGDSGKARAEAVAPRLKEMNPDMECIPLVESAGQVVSRGPQYLSQFTAVVACDVSPQTALELSRVLYAEGVPLVVADTFGFYGYLRVSVPEHTVVETHPDSLVDLRLPAPFPELCQFADTFDIDSLEDFELAHVPFVVLLLKFVERWKKSHDGAPPQTSEELREFKKMIEGEKNRRPDVDPENFDEAISAAWRLLRKPEIPSNVQALLQSASAQQVTDKSSAFWILAAALRRYVELPQSGGMLPLPGVLPDMKADTKSFVRLQNIYQARARSDFDAFKAIYGDILESVGKPRNAITDEEGATFCKNASYLTAVEGTPLEYLSPTTVAYDADAESLLHVYVGMMAAKLCKGRKDGDVDVSAESLLQQALGVAKLMHASELAPATEKVVEELARSGLGELHNVAALLAGVTAQEIIKLITHQYVPMDNTFIFDGIQSRSAVFKF